MDFLDAVPQDWGRPELPQLRDLLVSAYRRSGSLQQLADEVHLLPGTFPIAEDVRTICTELIRVLGNQGKLRQLVEKAAQDPTSVGYHDRLRELLGEPAREPFDPALVSTALTNLQTERLIEKRSRLVEIELASWVVAAAPSVARLTLQFARQRAYGTGFLIASNLLLTSHHNVQHETHGPAIGLTAEFDHDRDETPGRKRLTIPVSPTSVAGDPGADWVVLQLDGDADREPLQLGSQFPPYAEDLVVIIQHPDGSHKRFALEPLAVTEVSTATIRYMADTQVGSSGSPVFNEQMQVVAVHKGAHISTAAQGSERRTAWRNEGVRIDVVLPELERLSIPYVDGR